MPALSAAPECATSIEPVRVLIVDDNPEDIAIVRRQLAQYPRLKFDVVSAHSTSQCLEQLRGDGADLLLLDYSMPGEDGVSFLRRLATTIDYPPVILLTGRGDERLAVEAIRAGACDYFRKDSVTPSSLGDALQRALEQFQDRDERRRFDEQIMIALASAAENIDATTGGHLQRLAGYALLLGQELGLDEAQLRTLRYGALLHDIGKLAVSAKVLTKQGLLTEEEWEEIRQHPLVGERICSCLWFSRQVGPIIRHHHERWDGSGYVDGLSGADIPLLARIVSLADSFDAMSTDRPYRKALPRAEVVRRIKKGAGTQWDPDLAATFLEIIERPGFQKISASPAKLDRAA
jgi:putative two-component system response regulator